MAGVTHDHLNGVVSQLRQGDIQVAGVWEPDARYLHSNSLTKLIPENLFYSDLGKMLDETHPEAVVAYGSTKEHLATAVRGEIEAEPYDLCSLENNLIVMEILSAAVKSGRTGKPVKLEAPRTAE